MATVAEEPETGKGGRIKMFELVFSAMFGNLLAVSSSQSVTATITMKQKRIEVAADRRSKHRAIRRYS